MRKLYILGVIVGIISFNSCVDHTIIPPPLPLVELECECQAYVNDSLVKYQGLCAYSSTKEIVALGPSRAQYKTKVSSDDLPGGLELEIRSMTWVDNGTNNPDLDDWKAFLIDNPTPGYSGGIEHDGVVIRWTDPNGKVWVSDTTNDACIQTFIFNKMVQESDTTGKYMNYEASFDCKLVNSDYGTDSVKCVTGGTIYSSFKLE